MREIIGSVVVAVCLWLASSSSRAQAQTADAITPALLELPAPAQGYYVAGGLHGGLLYARDEGKSIRSLGGFSASLHLGQSVTTWMDLGIALELGAIVAGERSGTLFSFGFDWTIRPVETLFFRLSPAIGINQISAVTGSDDTANTFGTVLGLTVGYAMFPFYQPKESGGFAISPVVRLSAVQPFSDSAAYWAMAGVELSWWSGLPRHQLEMPLQDAFHSRPTPK